MTDYDAWLDRDLEVYFGDTEEQEEPEWDGPYPEDDYDGWDDMQ